MILTRYESLYELMDYIVELDDIRREYLAEGLHRSHLNTDPIEQFQVWMQQAITAQLQDPTAMTLATVNEHGEPSQRIVLLKQLDVRGFVFFTNYGSQKARDIEVNSNVSLHFPWHNLERQVKVLGRAEKLTKVESLRYFLSRPRASQLSAWSSVQSRSVSSRALLLQQFDSMKQKFLEGDIPLPDFWGGYCIVPRVIEFWQGRENRLHDRFEYRLSGKEWLIQRLSP